MKFAIIADIHANLEAFQVVLEDIKQQKCTHYACLGDVVGYNANPKECLDIVRKMDMPCRERQPRRVLLDGRSTGRVQPRRRRGGELDPQTIDPGGPPVVARPEVRSHGHQFHDCPCDARWPATLGLRVRQARCRRQLHLPEHRYLFLRPHACAGGVHAGRHGPRRHVFEVQGRGRARSILSTSAPSASRATTIPRPPTWCTTPTRAPSNTAPCSAAFDSSYCSPPP